MVKAQAASGICAHLNDPDPSGQLLFRSSEILWNLLEKSSKEEKTCYYANTFIPWYKKKS